MNRSSFFLFFERLKSGQVEVLNFGMRTLLVATLCPSLQAAPLPATSSSIYLNNKKNYFLHPFKISLDLESTPYAVDLSRNDEDKWVVSQSGQKYQITLRFKQFKSDLEYEKSLKVWIKELQKSGLQLISQQMGEKRPERGWLHLQDSKGQHLLLHFRYQNKTWVYFNCVGSKGDVQGLQKTCEDLTSRVGFITM